jgi:hypothetical protein
VLGDQRLGGVDRLDPAAVDDRNPLGEQLRLLHVVGGQHHGLALPAVDL